MSLAMRRTGLLDLPDAMLLLVVEHSTAPRDHIRWASVCAKMRKIALYENSRGVSAIKALEEGTVDLLDANNGIPVVTGSDIAATWPYAPFLIKDVRSKPGPEARRVPVASAFGCTPGCSCKECVAARRPNLVFFQWTSKNKALPENTTMYDGVHLNLFSKIPAMAAAAKALRVVRFDRTYDDLAANGQLETLLEAAPRKLARAEFTWCPELTAILPDSPHASNANIRYLKVDQCTAFHDPGAFAPKKQEAPGARCEVRITRCPLFVDVAPLQHATHITLERCSALADIKQMESFARLVQLDVTGCRGVKRLPRIVSLRKLVAARSGIECSDNMELLTIADLSSTQVEHVDTLRSVEELDVSASKVQTFEGFQSRALKSVSLSRTAVVDIGQLKGASTIIARGCHCLRSIENLAGGNTVTLDVTNTPVDNFPENNSLRTVVANNCQNLVSLQQLSGATSVSLSGAIVRDWGTIVGLAHAEFVNVSLTMIPVSAVRHLGRVATIYADKCPAVHTFDWVKPGKLLSVRRNAATMSNESMQHMKHREVLHIDNCSNRTSGVWSINGLAGGSVKQLSMVGLSRVRDVIAAKDCHTVTMNRCTAVRNGEVLRHVKVIHGPPAVVNSARKPSLRYHGATLWWDTARFAVEFAVTVENTGRGWGAPPLTAFAMGGGWTTTQWETDDIAPFSTARVVYRFSSEAVAAWSTDAEAIDVGLGHGHGEACTVLKSVPITRHAIHDTFQ